MTIFEAYNNCKRQLESFGIEDYVFESKQIIKHITGYTSAQILTNYTDNLTEFQQNNLTAIIKQRQIRYPLQYILGRWNFYGREFFVGAGVLIPRSDTETLIDTLKNIIKQKESAAVLDLCSGTGCIGITLKCECENCDVTVVEKYDDALKFLKKNALHNNADIKIVKGDVFESDGASDRYDIIVGNPPYITNADMKNLQPEVTFEPDTALCGGEDGLDFYRAIINNYKTALNAGGVMAFEVGINQAKDVAKIMKDSGFETELFKDLNGVDRVVLGTVK